MGSLLSERLLKLFACMMDAREKDINNGGIGAEAVWSVLFEDLVKQARTLEANQRTERDAENERLRQAFGEHWRKDGGSDGSHWDAQDIVSILRDAIERKS